MIVDRKHIPWALVVLAGTAGLAALYVANFHPDRLPQPVALPRFFGEVPPSHGTIGGTPYGILLGGAAFGIFIFAALLGPRKKKRLWRVGTVESWLRAHIWLSIFTIPLVLFHCGLERGGPMTTLLLTLYTVVMASGFYGLALQQFMPRMMTQRLTLEVVYEQIPHLRDLLVEQALVAKLALLPGEGKEREKLVKELRSRYADDDFKSFKERHKFTANKWEDLLAPPAAKAAAAPPKAAAAPAPPQIEGVAPVPTEIAVATAELPPVDPSPETLIEFLDKEVIPYLKAWRGEKIRLGKRQSSDDLFRLLKLNVAAPYRLQVEAMQSWCDDRRQMDLQMKLHHWLHGWLLVHIPFSLLLIIFTGWHAVAALLFF